MTVYEIAGIIFCVQLMLSVRVQLMFSVRLVLCANITRSRLKWAPPKTTF